MKKNLEWLLYPKHPIKQTTENSRLSVEYVGAHENNQEKTKTGETMMNSNVEKDYIHLEKQNSVDLVNQKMKGV